MSPKMRLFARQSLPVRVRQPLSRNVPFIPSRAISAKEKPLPTSDQQKGPNQDQLPHVSEEAAATSKSMGEVGPELSQGTPVQDV